MVGKLDGKIVIDYMGSVAGIMANLEAGKIFYSDIRPENLAVISSVIKITDLGVLLKLNKGQAEKSEMVAEMINSSRRYLPPEVLDASKDWPERIDVYNWGMTFYQLLSRKNNLDLENETSLRLTDYKKFLNDNINKIRIEGGIDPNLQKKIIKILLQVLDSDYKKRPSFEEIEIMMHEKNYFVEKLREARKKLREMISKRDKSKNDYDKLCKENTALKTKCDNLTKESGNNELIF